MKEWEYIKGYNEKYIINTDGKLINTIKSKEVSTRISNKGYLRVNLYYKSNQYDKFIHRLVAETFIPNPENKPCVNHIDGNKQNNNVNNLEWCTYSENEIHAYKIGIKRRSNKQMEIARDIMKKYNITNSKAKPIIQYDKNGCIIKKWDSIKSAEYKLKLHHISRCCLHKQKTAGGFIWEFDI